MEWIGWYKMKDEPDGCNSGKRRERAVSAFYSVLHDRQGTAFFIYEGVLGTFKF